MWSAMGQSLNSPCRRSDCVAVAVGGKAAYQCDPYDRSALVVGFGSDALMNRPARQISYMSFLIMVKSIYKQKLYFACKARG